MREGMEGRSENLDHELDGLLAEYREACVAPEPSADFMPRVWERIEGRSGFLKQLYHWTEGFVAAAAAACLLIMLLQFVPPHNSPYYTTTYLESLAEDQAPDRLVLQDVAYSSIPDRPAGAEMPRR